MDHHLRLRVAALRTRCFCGSAVETIIRLPGRFPRIVSSFPHRSHNMDTTGSDWPELLLPSLKSTGSDQYLNPLVYFFFLSFFSFFFSSRFTFSCRGFRNQSATSQGSDPWAFPTSQSVRGEITWTRDGNSRAAMQGGERGRERGAHYSVRACVRQCANVGIMSTSRVGGVLNWLEHHIYHPSLWGSGCRSFQEKQDYQTYFNAQQNTISLFR